MILIMLNEFMVLLLLIVVVLKFLGFFLVNDFSNE